MIADPDTLLIYVELTDRIIPSRGPPAAGRAARRTSPTPSRSACLSVAQVQSETP